MVRVAADEGALQFPDGLGNRRLAVLQGGFADAVQSLVGQDFHEHPVRAVGVAKERA